jgi:hypothetical protein
LGDGIAMQEYKKRLRTLGERFSLRTKYDFCGGISLQGDRFNVSFSPTSKSAMSCTVTTIEPTWSFNPSKRYSFDVVHQLCTGRQLATYQPKGNPLTLQEYLNEEDAVDRFDAWRMRFENGHQGNIELGGNHYNAEFYNGILIVFDIVTGAPTNVYDFSEIQNSG